MKRITIREVTERYGISRASVSRYIDAGILTAYRVGPRLIRLDADEVERQLAVPVTAKDSA